MVLCALIIMAWVAWAFAVRALIPDWHHRGIFGDTYGSLTALFTGLAFAGLVYTILLQKLQLIEAEKEQAAQRNDSRQQRIENTFFQLLHSLNQIIDSTEITAPDSEQVKSRACFAYMFNELRISHLMDPQYDNLTGTPKLEAAYAAFYAKFQNNLGHYYRTMYNIFKFIDRPEVENGEFYARLVRAQLSSQQLLLLFYNCLVEVGDGFKPFVEKYALLKHIPEELVADKALLSLYSPTAYGRQAKI